jgi:flavin-binding protein dodecin
LAAARARRKHIDTKEGAMTESVYKIIELVGSSPVSWEEAAKNAVNSAGLTLRDLRIAEVQTLDMKIDGDKPVLFRAKIKLSFKLVSD